MKILFASAAPYLPQLYGGVNTNTHELIAEFALRGHSAAVLSRLSYGNWFGGRRAIRMGIAGRRISCDEALGYPVYRARQPWLGADEVPPHDVVIVQDGRFLDLARAFIRTGTAVVGYFHGLEFEDWDKPGARFRADDLPCVPYVVNSQFTAARFRSRHGIEPSVVTPVIRHDRYRSDWRPANVTFINPVQEKGVDLALAIAERCPEIPFVFVEGWPLGLQHRWRLMRRIRALRNVTLQPRTNDMRTVYQHCRVLLVPSAWSRETWGRVASEAQINGIPVLASDIGGLPEAIGPGGTTLSRTDPAETWAEALRRLWHDEAFFRHKSQMALGQSQRNTMQVDRQVDILLDVLERAVSAPKKSKPMSGHRFA